MRNLFPSRKFYLALSYLGLCVMVLLVLTLSLNANVNNQQFSELANSFLHHKLYFIHNSPFDRFSFDSTYFNNHYYWPLGPFPAVLLMPFVAWGNFIGIYFFQAYLNFDLIILIVYLVFKIARRLGYDKPDAICWASTFIFGTMFIGVATVSASWYFAHSVAVALVFLAINEYLGRKRPLLIGFLFGLILLTRVTAFLGILFFAVDILFFEKNTLKEKGKNIIKLALIPALCLLMLLSYNYARFNNIFEQGYGAQILKPAGFMVDRANYGLFNLKYLPRGLYYSLLNAPQPIYNSDTHLLVFPYLRPDVWGMSIFVTSPFLLYFFFMKTKNKKAKVLIINSILIGLVIAGSFFIGYTQFGFRYALDFLPLLFLAFMMIYHEQKNKIGPIMKIIIALTFLTNFYLLVQAVKL